MTGVTVGIVDQGSADEPPAGTAIVRPMRYVRAVRQRHAEQLAERASARESRAVRAWSWALGETALAPVTDRITDMPPSREVIEGEIAEADERRLRGDRENRADGAASVLRWLNGTDDRVPVRGPNRGELVGGFGEVVRSPDQVALALRDARQRRSAGPRAADYCDGVIATLEWVLGEQLPAPISGQRSWPITTSQLKYERLHAEDSLRYGQARTAAEGLSASFGSGVQLSIAWLLGEVVAISL